MEQPKFDVFLAHNSLDKPEVIKIAQYLKKNGLNPWLDKEQIFAGDNIQKVVSQGISQSKVGAFFISQNGLGTFQENLELGAIINLFLKKNNAKGFRVIPILLPGINDIPEDLYYLSQWAWIKFTSSNDEEALENLIRGIRGRSAAVQEQPVTAIPETPRIIQHSSSLTTPSQPDKKASFVNSHLGVQPNISADQAEEILNSRLNIQPPTATDNLDSEKGIDYTRLRDLLAAENWKEADQETYRVMIKAVGKKEGDWFTEGELLNFPCTDLRTIDRLWVKYSNGHFGFSVQKEIYLSVGGKADGNYDSEAWKKFGDRVGWRVNGSWIRYSNVTFDTSSPRGHLPINIFVVWLRLELIRGSKFSSLASKLVNCNI
ncbi:GUN4 domain-containing protein [Nodularia sp. NIES-3585]|uniref:GUN4 domain-containing protein n=1 Tax=Nodularia sp. NIES-3585 TaxID=1973477 RepID=UPI000B6242EA|nr:GUN4 domain-containing protein [Nodularia sp. NIES-3585]GAX38743.1 GUN4 domain-containing protein [Nodularia sp. NIES-3585]